MIYNQMQQRTNYRALHLIPWLKVYGKDISQLKMKRCHATSSTSLGRISINHFCSSVHVVEGQAFKCASDNCTVPDTLVRDQIIIRVRDDDLRKNALKEQ